MAYDSNIQMKNNLFDEKLYIVSIMSFLNCLDANSSCQPNDTNLGVFSKGASISIDERYTY